MTTTFELVRNEITNPSFETGTTGYTAAVAGSTIAQTAVQAWVGSYAGRITCTGASTGQGFYFNRTTIAALQNQNWSGQLRAKAVTGTSTIKFGITECNAAGTVLTTTYTANTLLSAGSWTYFFLTYTTTQATCAFISVIVITTSAQNVVFDIDGVMLAKEDQPSAYVDGDQGSLYHWVATAHASASYRDSVTAQEAIGSGGVVQMQPSLYRATRAGTLLEDISAQVVDGTVTFDATDEIHLRFKATLKDPTVVTAYTDFLAPFLKLTYADGSEVEAQVGLFMVVPAQRTYSQSSTQGEIDGRGMEWILAIDEFPNGYTVEAGQDYVAAVITMLNLCGITRYSIPLSGLYLPVTRTWEPGTARIKVVNDLLDAITYYPIHTTRDGTLRSFPQPDLDHVESSSTFTTAAGRANIVDVVTESPDSTGFGNRVVVVLDDPSRTSVTVIARNDNPASPSSTVRLGFTKTVEHRSANIHSITEATALANRMLQRAANHLVKYTIKTIPSPLHDPFEVYTLDIEQSDGTSIALGNYYCLGWTLGFHPSQGAMTHTVQRLEIFQ